MTVARHTLIGATLLLTVVLTLLSLTVGVADFSWSRLFSDPQVMTVLTVSRGPRTIAIILTGTTLAIAGMLLQIVLTNKFVEPSMIGATQSAALGVLLVTLVMPGLSLFWKIGAAGLTSLAGMGILLWLLTFIPKEDRLMVPLTGIIFSGIISGIAHFIALETDTLQLLAVWFSGDFSGVLAGRYEWLWLSGAAAALIYVLADRLTIAGLGKGIAVSLGINYRQMLWVALVSTALISALVVVTIGQIPFLGLVVPNIVSRLFGDNLRRNLPVVALFGADFLLLSDLIGRTINAPYEIPISTVFGVIGTVIFLTMLLRKAPHAD